MARNCSIRSLTKSTKEYAPLYELVHADLSVNHLHVIHPYVFSGFPSLKTLNLSHNVIHTMAATAFSLPALQTLDLSRNQASAQCSSHRGLWHRFLAWKITLFLVTPQLHNYFGNLLITVGLTPLGRQQHFVNFQI